MRKSSKKVTPAMMARWTERAREKAAAHELEYRRMLRGAPILSTRIGRPGTDAHRDMDGFCPDEELRRFALAVERRHYTIASRLAANLDEHLRRGGSPPAAWLGPLCMRS